MAKGRSKAGSRWLVIGGAGFIGGHLVDRLISEGSSVSVIDSFAVGKYRNSKANYFRADVRDRPRMIRLISRGDYDTVVGAWATKLRKSISNPTLANDVNALAVLNVLDAIARTDSLYIHLSTGSVYGHGGRTRNRESGPTIPSSTYGVSKLAGESYVRVYSETHGMKAVMLRLHSVYGPRQNAGRYGGVAAIFIQNVLNNKPPVVFGDGKDTRPFLYVQDSVRAILLAASEKRALGLAINIAGRRSYSINYLAQLVIRLTHSSLTPRHKTIVGPTVSRFYSSLGMASDLLKFKSEVDLRTGLSFTIDAFKNEKKLHH